MSNIHFPSDNPPVTTATGKNKTQQPLQHTDAVNKDSKQRNKQPKKEKKSDRQPENQHPEQKDSQQVIHTYVARSEDRRKNNRRKQHQSVLLDTRSGQDRRKTHGQRKDDVIDENTTFGIDTKA